METFPETVQQYPMLHWDRGAGITQPQDLIGEEPLSIRVQGKPYSVVMRTPGNEIAHVAGFCLGEGIVDSPDDFTSIGFCDGIDSNVVTVTLKPSRRDKITEVLDRRGFISQTSCGLCGKEIVKDLYQRLKPLPNASTIDFERASRCLENLSGQQPLRRKTRAAHAAVIYDSDYHLLAAAEDVGRHNAVDKAVGKLFLDRKLKEAALLVLSSRISYELVQKAARARIGVIVAMSRPTALAVTLATELNMALACGAKTSGLEIFCGIQRFSQPS